MTDATGFAAAPSADDTSRIGSGSRFAAFISYCHADSKSAVALQRFLETYRLPRDVAGTEADRATLQARLRPVFLDRADMAAATDLRGEIDAALLASDALIVVCSPAAARSRWVNLEIERFRQQHGDSRIFAVIIDGVAHASEHAAGADRECFPPALRLRETPAGPVRADPAGVDLRRKGDGQQVGRLRLVAGLVGVPLDQLVHRDARRRHRRTLALIIGLSLGLAATSALALYALAARNEAQRQRFAAEGMIEFMIGDLRKTLEPMGRLSAMDPLGRRALDYYRQQDAGALDADSLGRRARVLQLLGEIQDQRGNLDIALRNFEVAAGTTRELLERTPADPKRMFDHAQSVYWVGYIAWRRGQFAVAMPAFEDYRYLADRLVAIDPANPAYQAEKGYAYSNLGTMWFTTGHNTEAEPALRQALAVSMALARGKPASAAEQYDLALAHAWVAEVTERRGNVADAAAQRQAQRRVLDDILKVDSLNYAARESLVECDRAEARLALARGEDKRASSLAQAAARTAQQLAAADPGNAEAAFAAALSFLTLADTRLAAQDADSAAAAVAVAQRYLRQLDTRDHRVAKWRLADARAIVLSSRIAAKRGQSDAALRLAGQALSVLQAIPAGDQDVSDQRWLQNLALLEAGDAQLAKGDRTAARAHFTNVINDKTAASTEEEPRISALKARAAHAIEPL